MLKRFMRADVPPRRPQVLFVEGDCTGVIVIEMFDASDKVGTYFVLLHDCLQSCNLNPVKDLLEVCEDILEVLLLLKMFSSKDS